MGLQRKASFPPIQTIRDAGVSPFERWTERTIKGTPKRHYYDGVRDSEAGDAQKRA